MANHVITDETPDAAMARAKAICGLIQFSPATLWRKEAEGSFPRKIKLSGGITVWRVGDVRQWLAQRAQA